MTTSQRKVKKVGDVTQFRGEPELGVRADALLGECPAGLYM